MAKRRYLDDVTSLASAINPELANVVLPEQGTIKGDNRSWRRRITDEVAGSVKQQLAGNIPVSPWLAYPAAGVVASTLLNPVTSVGMLAKGALLGEVVNEANKQLTGKSFGETTGDLLDINPEVAAYLNPGYLAAGRTGRFDNLLDRGLSKVLQRNVSNLPARRTLATGVTPYYYNRPNVRFNNTRRLGYDPRAYTADEQNGFEALAKDAIALQDAVYDYEQRNVPFIGYGEIMNLRDNDPLIGPARFNSIYGIPIDRYNPSLTYAIANGTNDATRVYWDSNYANTLQRQADEDYNMMMEDLRSSGEQEYQEDINSMNRIDNTNNNVVRDEDGIVLGSSTINEPFSPVNTNPAPSSVSNGSIFTSNNAELDYMRQFIKTYIDANGEIDRSPIDRLSNTSRSRLEYILDDLDDQMARKKAIDDAIAAGAPVIPNITRNPSINHYYASLLHNSVHGNTSPEGVVDITGATFFNPFGRPNTLLNYVWSDLNPGDRISIANHSGELSTDSAPLYFQNLARQLLNKKQKGFVLTPTRRISLNSLGASHYKGFTLPEQFDPDFHGTIGKNLNRALNNLLENYNYRYGVDLRDQLLPPHKKEGTFGSWYIPGFTIEKLKYGGSIPRRMLATGGSIHIKPENRGKFTATMKRTGKSAEELSHSKNPLTRKRAIFALNARKWKH